MNWLRAADVLPRMEESRHPRTYKCPVCPFPIRPDDPVVKLSGGWTHVYCVEVQE